MFAEFQHIKVHYSEVLCVFLALIYYTLGNVHPKYRSRLMCIQLLAVVKSSVLQQYGPDVVLEPFMDDIKTLESVSNKQINKTTTVGMFINN